MSNNNVSLPAQTQKLGFDIPQGEGVLLEV